VRRAVPGGAWRSLSTCGKPYEWCDRYLAQQFFYIEQMITLAFAERPADIGIVPGLLRCSRSAVSQPIPGPPLDRVIFGGTGDLARRKLLPALFHRFRDGQMQPGSRVIGGRKRGLDPGGVPRLGALRPRRRGLPASPRPRAGRPAGADRDREADRTRPRERTRSTRRRPSASAACRQRLASSASRPRSMR
jgi:hypothetical protein